MEKFLLLLKRTFFTLTIALFSFKNIYCQCNINFSTLGTAGTVIVQNGGTQTSTIQYDIWNETNGSCSSSGGVSDMTITYEIITTFDPYNGNAVHTTNGTNYKVEYSGTGLKGTLGHGHIAATRSSPGDTRCYKITVDFASHVNNITASDFSVDLTSVNTGGTAFESSAIVFKDRSGIPYGTFDYAGYYQMNPGNLHPGIVSTCPNVPPLPATSNAPWATTGTGVYTADANSVDISANSCNPVGGSSGPNDNTDVLASNTGLQGNAGIGGFVYQVCLENVATFTLDVENSAVNTNFTSTLNGFSIMGQALPVTILTFEITKKSSSSVLTFSTATETNNDYFTIERSVDGRQYEVIGEIKGAGNTTEEKRYEYADENPVTGINYYRIKQTDYDGRYSYSEIRSVRHKGISNVSITPRTTEGRLDINTELEDYTIAIYNAAGQEVKKMTGMSLDQSISLETLHAGVYFVKINSRSESETVRIVKI